MMSNIVDGLSNVIDMTNANAQHLKRNILIKTKLMNWIWDNIINTKRGWHEYVQEEIDEIDIDQLMSDRAEEYNQGICDTYD